MTLPPAHVCLSMISYIHFLVESFSCSVFVGFSSLMSFLLLDKWNGLEFGLALNGSFMRAF